MDFKKISIFSIGVILFNIALGLHDLNWYSSVQFALAGFLIWMEVRKQLMHRQLLAIQRQIEENTFTIEDLDAIFADPRRIVQLPPSIFHFLVRVRRRHFENNVNWERDGF